MNIVKASRSQSKIRLGITGPAGSGKTYSALKVAYGLCGEWDNIVLIDTEHGSSHLYSDLGEYSVMELHKPFSPEKYKQAIEFCLNAGYKVIIIDSLSHCWDGEGGILEIHANMVGSSFVNWGKVKPRFQSLIQDILSSKAHVIATLRTKTEYTISERNGKHVVEKVGTKLISQDGIDYEFTIVLDMDVKHNATSSKDRTGLFVDTPPFTPSEKTGIRIKKWCEMTLSEVDIIQKIDACGTEEEIRKVYESAGPYKESLKTHFKEKWNQIIIQNAPSNGTSTDNK